MASCVLGAALLIAGAAGAQTWPGGAPVRIIQNSPPGSAADAVARAMAEALSEVIGQPVVVENVAGGGGQIGIGRVMQARRDGTTILSAVSGTLIGPMLDRAMQYEIGRDLIPVSQTTGAMAAFLVRAEVPATTLTEFLAWARSGSRPLDFGNYGYGSSSHLQGLLLARHARLAAESVHYTGTSQLTTDLLGGRLCCAFIDTGSAREFVRAGQLRPLAVTGPRRASYLPDVPTFAELGIAGFEPQIWQGMFLPAGTPAGVVEAVGRALAEATRRPGPTRLIRDIGYEAVGSSPEEFAAMIARDAPVWRRIIEETGVRVR
jgi:tripartite-type tricarboxylate transporter receptor subunit TctC